MGKEMGQTEITQWKLVQLSVGCVTRTTLKHVAWSELSTVHRSLSGLAFLSMFCRVFLKNNNTAIKYRHT